VSFRRPIWNFSLRKCGRASLAPPGQEGQPTTQEISRSIVSVVRRCGRSGSRNNSAEFDPPPASLSGCFAIFLEIARSALLRNSLLNR